MSSDAGSGNYARFIAYMQKSCDDLKKEVEAEIEQRLHASFRDFVDRQCFMSGYIDKGEIYLTLTTHWSEIIMSQRLDTFVEGYIEVELQSAMTDDVAEERKDAWKRLAALILEKIKDAD